MSSIAGSGYLDDLRHEWERFSAEWIARSEAKADAASEEHLDDWMLDQVGDVDGRYVIDLGCGEGRFSRMLVSHGRALEAARARGEPAGQIASRELEIDGSGPPSNGPRN